MICFVIPHCYLVFETSILRTEVICVQLTESEKIRSQRRRLLLLVYDHCDHRVVHPNTPNLHNYVHFTNFSKIVYYLQSIYIDRKTNFIFERKGERFLQSCKGFPSCLFYIKVSNFMSIMDPIRFTRHLIPILFISFGPQFSKTLYFLQYTSFKGIRCIFILRQTEILGTFVLSSRLLVETL